MRSLCSPHCRLGQIGPPTHWLLRGQRLQRGRLLCIAAQHGLVLQSHSCRMLWHRQPCRMQSAVLCRAIRVAIMDRLPEEMFNKYVKGGDCPDQLQEAKASSIQLRQVRFCDWPALVTAVQSVSRHSRAHCSGTFCCTTATTNTNTDRRWHKH